MTANEKKYLKSVYENNFEIGEGNKKIDEESYEVDKNYDSSGIVFLSEWFFDEEIHHFTKIDKSFLNKILQIPTQYNFPDSNQKLNREIKRFHEREGFKSKNSEIFITEGSTPMISSMVIFAKALGFHEILSVPPLYFNIFKVAELIDIPIRCINQDSKFLSTKLDLPKQRSFLFITDPIWSIGKHHSAKVVSDIKKWQDSTGSLVFVDGSFSYTDWYSTRKFEPTSILNPELTFRLVCPTKALGLNGLRFSYLICPGGYKKELSRVTCSTIGSSSYFSHIYRDRILKK
jgi:histidinol-phosphate/aromatic aminotransferase/cobyric acid decarboxylase-like protein